MRVWPGEIVGIAGLVGSGRTTFLRALFGADRAHVDAALDGRPYHPKAPGEAIAMGVGLVPEDRRLQGLVVDHSVADNLALASLPRLSRFGFVGPSRVAAFAQRLIAALAIKVSNPRVRAGALSGGNQQRIVLGKWMGGNVRLLLLDEPTRGIDVGAKAELFGELRADRRRGRRDARGQQRDRRDASQLRPDPRLLRGPTRGRVPARRAEPDRHRQRHGHRPDTRED